MTKLLLIALLAATTVPMVSTTLNELERAWTTGCIEGSPAPQQCVKDARAGIDILRAGFERADYHPALRMLARQAMKRCASAIKEQGVPSSNVSAPVFLASCSVYTYNRVIEGAGGEGSFIQKWLDALKQRKPTTFDI